MNLDDIQVFINGSSVEFRTKLAQQLIQPDRRSVPLINLVSCDAACVVAAGGGLIMPLSFM